MTIATSSWTWLIVAGVFTVSCGEETPRPLDAGGATCASVSCENEGVCMSGVCRCAEGFLGDYCTEAASVPCAGDELYCRGSELRKCAAGAPPGQLVEDCADREVYRECLDVCGEPTCFSSGSICELNVSGIVDFEGALVGPPAACNVPVVSCAVLHAGNVLSVQSKVHASWGDSSALATITLTFDRAYRSGDEANLGDGTAQLSVLLADGTRCTSLGAGNPGGVIVASFESLEVGSLVSFEGAGAVKCAGATSWEQLSVLGAAVRLF